MTEYMVGLAVKYLDTEDNKHLIKLEEEIDVYQAESGMDRELDYEPDKLLSEVISEAESRMAQGKATTEADSEGE